MNASLASMLERIEDPAFLHASPSFTESLARLHFAIEHRQELAALLGPPGVGKTALLRHFRRELIPSPACVVQLDMGGMSLPELQIALSEQLGLGESFAWGRVAERLTELGYDDTLLVLLVDHAEGAPAECFDFLARLWSADPNGRARITMVMATGELGLVQWPATWLSRLDLRIDLQRWTADDVGQFLTAVVGDEKKRGRGFEPDAVAKIYALSEGLPRLVRRLAQISLLASDGHERTMVDETTVTGVSYELCRVGEAFLFDGPPIEFIDDHVFELRLPTATET